MTNDRCACGRALHYADPERREKVERLIALVGDDHVRISVLDSPTRTRTFRVQRHYIALHGVSADDLVTGRVPCEELTDG